MSCSSSSRAVVPFSVLWLVDTDSQAHIPIETHTIKKIKINLRKIKEVDRSREMIPAAELCFYTKVHESLHSYTLRKIVSTSLTCIPERKLINILYMK